jgi:hypothetical protein
MKSEHSLEYLAPHHQGILAAAALAGCDLDGVVAGATRLIGYGNTKYGYGPACVIDLLSTDYVMEPHVIWFPWTTAANKIVNFKWAMNLMAETHQVLLNVEKKHSSFFDHFARKGFLRKIGVIEDLPIVQEIHMYQVRRNKP